MKTSVALLILTFTLTNGVFSQNVGDMEIVAGWARVEFDWDSEEQMNSSISDGTYVPDNNVITGLKVHKDVVYVTVSRWLPGIPSTMNTLVFKDGRPYLRPFPSWEMQELDNCDALQFTQSMEIDPHTDEMWIIDAGRRNIWLETPANNCPPKIVILDLNTGQVKHSYSFPNEVLSHTGNHVNDIAIDPGAGFAYLSDTGVSSTGYGGGMVFYDRSTDTSKRSEHPSMEWEVNRPDGGYDLHINGKPYEMSIPSDGVGLTTDRKNIFYSSLGGVHLHQVMAATLRSACDDLVCILSDNQVRDMGPKVSECDGILWGHRSLYFASIGTNAIYRWDHQADLEEQGVNELWQVNMTKQVEVKKDDESIIWADTFMLDDKGWLWASTNRLPLFRDGELDYSGEDGFNFRVIKVFVDDKSYLMPEDNSSHKDEMV